MRLILFGERGGEVQADYAQEDRSDIAAVWYYVLLARLRLRRTPVLWWDVPVPIVQAGSKSMVYV